MIHSDNFGKAAVEHRSKRNLLRNSLFFFAHKKLKRFPVKAPIMPTALKKKSHSFSAPSSRHHVIIISRVNKVALDFDFFLVFRVSHTEKETSWTISSEMIVPLRYSNNWNHVSLVRPCMHWHPAKVDVIHLIFVRRVSHVRSVHLIGLRYWTGIDWWFLGQGIVVRFSWAVVRDVSSINAALI